MQFQAIKFMEEAEGRKAMSYFDSAGKLTIGIGHLITPKEIGSRVIVIAGEKVTWNAGLSDAQIDTLLRQDLAIAHQAVHDTVQVDLTQNQHDALVSFVFNIGVSAWRKSIALAVLNKHHYADVPGCLRQWNKETKGGRKVVSRGLVNRREVEIRLWNTQDEEV